MTQRSANEGKEAGSTLTGGCYPPCETREPSTIYHPCPNGDPEDPRRTRGSAEAVPRDFRIPDTYTYRLALGLKLRGPDTSGFQGEQ